ncbi:hypothetical protein Tco_1477976 [Tanacetum coccineum]
MDDPNITMEKYIRLEEEKARRCGKVYNWKTATYDKIWDNEDVHDLGSVETEFPSIVFNDTLTSKAALSCEPMVRIYQKSQENRQKRASADTRIRRVQKEAKESKPKPEKSNPRSNPMKRSVQRSSGLESSSTAYK